MQLATPFLFPSANVISEGSPKKSKSKSASTVNIVSDQPVIEPTTVQDSTELTNQDLARRMASCCDCV